MKPLPPPPPQTHCTGLENPEGGGGLGHVDRGGLRYGGHAWKQGPNGRAVPEGEIKGFVTMGGSAVQF